MIRVSFYGHIKTSMGADAIDLAREEVSVDDLFRILLENTPAGRTHGFTKYNTLLVVDDAEVFAAASQSQRLIRDGTSVLMVPFSHGG